MYLGTYVQQARATMASQLFALLTSRSSLVNAVAGSTGAMVSIAAVYPLIVLRTQAAMNANKKASSSAPQESPPVAAPGDPNTSTPPTPSSVAEQHQQQHHLQQQQLQQRRSLGSRLATALRALLSLYNGLPVALVARAGARLADPRQFVELPTDRGMFEVWENRRTIWPSKDSPLQARNGILRVPVMTGLRKYDSCDCCYLIGASYTYEQFRELLVNAPIVSAVSLLPEGCVSSAS